MKWVVHRTTTIVIEAPDADAAYLIAYRSSSAQQLLSAKTDFTIDVDDAFDDQPVDLPLTDAVLNEVISGLRLPDTDDQLSVSQIDLSLVMKEVAAKEALERKHAAWTAGLKKKAGVGQREKTPLERQMQVDKWVAIAKAKAKREGGE